MKKHLLMVFIMVVFAGLQSFAQQPPVLVSFADTFGSTTVTLFITIVPADTGIVIAEVEMSEGTGNEIYDSLYRLGPYTSATDTQSAVLNVGPIYSCTNYQMLFNMNNDFPGNTGQGPLYNPLTTLTTLCDAAIEPVAAYSFHLIVTGDVVELHSSEVPENAVAEIYDLTGRKVSTVSLNQVNQTLPLNTNSSMYLLRIVENSQTLYTTRFAHL